jgi:hypothetical protein
MMHLIRKILFINFSFKIANRILILFLLITNNNNNNNSTSSYFVLILIICYLNEK